MERDGEIKLLTRVTSYFLLCALAGLSGGLLFGAAAAQSTRTPAPLAWGCAEGGSGAFGQCKAPNGLSGVTAIAASQVHSLALKDGTVVAWGCHGGFDAGQCNVPSGLSGVRAIAAGDAHSLALKSDGTVVAWGCGTGADNGQCNVPGGLSGVTAIVAADLHSLALKGDGTVVAWGCESSGNNHGQCSVPSGLSGVTAIAAGDFHSLALKSNGTVVAWGCGGGGTNYGQCSVPSGLSGVIAIAADRYHSLVLAELMSQTIAFGPLANKTYGDAQFTVSATASSGLAVSFAASGKCLVSNAWVHLTGAGSCTVTASQPGDLIFNSAPDVSRTFRIAPASCVVPRLVGKRVASAKRTIARRHCRTGKVGHAYSRKHGKGIVISQSRRPGRVLPARSKINLVVSRGSRR